MTVRITSTRRVVCLAHVPLPLSASMAWGQLRDFRSSATHDPFHAEIQIDGGIPRPGAKLLVTHRYLFRQIVRVGKIMWWKEGAGYAYSDLCQSQIGQAFPHVLKYQLEATSDRTCVLHITVGGRWTAACPRWMGRLWLWWVFSQVVRTTRNRLLRFALMLKYRTTVA